MFRATGKRLMNGFQAPGKECGSLAIMIIGAVGWQDIMKIAKPKDTMRIEGFGSKDITGLIKFFNLNCSPTFRAGLEPRPLT
jgi:hypothetical protein